ncbi:LacI family DNA-binding transcriptional regulator [uncultured Corynebacterium sp.]|uniref:LacI family DNA-binding transcriptional regulator n=1 Tax=uncultured Corynebacterium sp. TaxID=159447 RepID=UPI0025DEC3A5|nr:LacI family DNA-binding transcriptional regulator [uncultured Corynebacterium sp.]
MVKRVTLGDVAKAAGVSTATVSMALNRKPGSRIPTSTIDKVKAAAQELGYRPNNAARALKTGKTGVLGFISDEVTITRFASPMISGILEYAEQAGLSVMMAETAHKDVQLAETIENLEGRNVDGLIVGLMASREIELPETTTPIVVCNGMSQALPCVLADDFTAGHDAISYLAARGHTRIGVIGRYPRVGLRAAQWPQRRLHRGHVVARREVRSGDGVSPSGGWANSLTLLSAPVRELDSLLPNAKVHSFALQENEHQDIADIPASRMSVKVDLDKEVPPPGPDLRTGGAPLR